MTGYLEQLERDLVEAVDRREAARAERRRPRRPRWRLDWAPVATAAVLAIAIAIAVVLVSQGPDRERAVAPPAAEPDLALRVAGGLTRIDATTWSVRALGPGGAGVLTIAAPADLTAPGGQAPHSVSFAWTTAGGSLGGCIADPIHGRAGGRIVWDGQARITAAGGTLRRYRERGLRITGETGTAAGDQARLPAEPARSPQSPPPLPARC